MNAPTQVAEAPPSPGIEYEELSAFLGAQRAKYDELRIACQEKHRELAKLTSDCRQLEEEEGARSKGDSDRAARVRHLHERSDRLRSEKEALSLKERMYRHVLSRTKRGILELDKQADLVNDDIAEAKKRHTMASNARDKQKQALDLLAARYQRLESEVESRRRVRRAKVKGAQKRLAGLQTLNRRRAERERRRQEIALEVAGDLGAEDEQRLREAFLSRQMYSDMLAEKLAKHATTSAALQLGFQHIKAVTGLTDVDRIIHKYRTRDETYASLVEQVAAAEDRIDALRRRNEELRREVEDAREGAAGGQTRQLYKEVDASDQCLEDGRRRRDDLRARAQHSTMTLEAVRQCVGKLLLLLDPHGTGARRVEGVAPAPSEAEKTACPGADGGAAEAGQGWPSTEGSPVPAPAVVRMDSHHGAAAHHPARLVALDGTTAPLPSLDALPAFMEEVSARVDRLTRLVGEVDRLRGGGGGEGGGDEGGEGEGDLLLETDAHNIRVKPKVPPPPPRTIFLPSTGMSPAKDKVGEAPSAQRAWEEEQGAPAGGRRHGRQRRGMHPHPPGPKRPKRGGGRHAGRGRSTAAAGAGNARWRRAQRSLPK